MKSLRSSLILIVIAAALGGYIYFNERGPIATAGNTVLLRTDPKKVSSIDLTGPGARTLGLRRNGDTWFVQTGNGVAPFPANPDTVKALLDQLQLVQSDATASNDPSRLKEYGLDKPRDKLEVAGSTIEFGSRPTFEPGKVYARIGDRVALVPYDLNGYVEKTANDWRDKSVLRATAGDVTQIAITAPLVAATFVKDTDSSGASSWKLSQPVQTPADSELVDGFVEQLTTNQIARFLDTNPKSPAAYGLDHPVATLALTTRDGVRALKVGKAVSGGRAAQNSTSPAVFVLTTTDYNLINRPLRQWRSKQVANFSLSDLTQVEIGANGAQKTFVKSSGQWQQVGGGLPTAGAEARNQAVLDLLIGVQGLSAQDFIDAPGALATYGLDRPRLSLTLTGSKLPAPLELNLGSVGGKAYARAGNGPVDALSPHALDSFTKPLGTIFAKSNPAGATSSHK